MSEDATATLMLNVLDHHNETYTTYIIMAFEEFQFWVIILYKIRRSFRVRQFDSFILVGNISVVVALIFNWLSLLFVLKRNRYHLTNMQQGKYKGIPNIMRKNDAPSEILVSVFCDESVEFVRHKRCDLLAISWRTHCSALYCKSRFYLSYCLSFTGFSLQQPDMNYGQKF